MHPEKIAEQIKDLRAEFAEELLKLQAECPHKHVVECDYKPQTFFNDLKPRRLCLGCRLEEEGWGNYEKLALKREGVSGGVEICEKIDRDELYKLRWIA